jgi:hypothetical protein
MLPNAALEAAFKRSLLNQGGPGPPMALCVTPKCLTILATAGRERLARASQTAHRAGGNV